MAHFAFVKNNIVQRIHVVANEAITDSDGIEHESWGQELLTSLHGGTPGEYLQCSYNGTIRGRYPGRGDTYDPERDAFIHQQPFESWILDEATCLWVAPVPYPEDGGEYTWHEDTTDWVEVVEPSAE